jgi:phosphoribosylamine--glycine ligase
VRVLVIGSGAREHALLLALAQDPGVTALACAPGNAGTAAVAEQRGVDARSPEAVTALARDWAADLVVVGPEIPLVAGVADAVRAAGIPVFGPGADAARIEGSKAFAKDVMASAGVATAASVIVDNPANLDAALASFTPPYVVKDDGLAAGKGVVVSPDLEVARAHAMHLLDDGHPVLLEAFLDGPEASFFCLVDGRTVVPLLPAQDFKRVGDDDTGPNTGGMGAYAPLPWAGGARGAGRRAPGGATTSSTSSSRGSCSPWRTRWRSAACPSAGCSTRASRSRRTGLPSSSSTAGSGTRRPRSSWRCCAPRWPGC